MDAPHQFLLVGLPASGKTTFLAALWHVVESNEVDASLRLATYDGDYAYLNQIRDKWLRGEAVGRTQTAPRPVHLPLVAQTTVDDAIDNGATGESFALDIPDMSGETFRDQWRSREWTTDFDALARRANGVLFFVHPDIKESREIADIAIAVGDTSGAVGDASGEAGEDSQDWEEETASAHQVATGKPWTPDESSTQIVAVELLQFLRRAAPSGPFSVAVVVSAWDLVPPTLHADEPPVPTRWVEERLPLLWQYLESNRGDVRWTAFGISAQGGDLESDGFKEGLAGVLDHAERVRVVAETGHEGHDISAPLVWLLG